MGKKKIRPNGSLAADYKRMSDPDSIDGSYTIAGNLEVDPSKLTSCLVGNFLRIIFTDDPVKTKPEFLYKVIRNEFLAGKGPAEMSHGILYSEVRKLVPICIISVCGTGLEFLPIQGNIVQIPSEIKTALDNHISRTADQRGDAEDETVTQLLTYLTSLKDTEEQGSDLQQCAEYILATIAYFTSNILHSFENQFGTLGHVVSDENKPRTSITSPQAILAKYFKDLELATYKYFTFKHNQQNISKADGLILAIIDDTHLSILEQVTSVELDKGFLFELETYFLSLVLILVTQAHLTSIKSPDRFLDCFCHTIVLLEKEILDKLACQIDMDVQMTAQEINRQIKDDLKPKLKAPKTKKRRAPKKKPKLAPDTTPSTGGINPPTILQRPTMREILSIQDEYIRLTHDSQKMESQIETLNNLKGVLQTSLDNQELIQTAEVFDQLNHQFYKLTTEDIQNPQSISSSSDFQERVGAPLTPPISIETRDKALAILKELQDQHTEKERATRKVQQEITASLKTLEAVVARKFSTSSDTPKQATAPNITDNQNSLDIQYIKEALNGSNPRFSSLRDLESFFWYLGCEVAPAGKHFAAVSGQQKVVTIAISTLQAERLYVKNVAVQLYDDDKFTAEKIHKALTEYLK
ncbi:hypothetical protein HOH51_00245 [bacterium]|nr:hypothetical protein [bacterium]